MLPDVGGVSPSTKFGELLNSVSAQKTAQGTDRLDWCFSGESMLGRTRLVPYADFDVFFYQVTKR